MKEVFCEEVIISTVSTRGQGIEGDPIRRIIQVYTKDGDLIAENDSHTFTAKDMIAFAKGCNGLQELIDFTTLYKWQLTQPSRSR